MKKDEAKKETWPRLTEEQAKKLKKGYEPWPEKERLVMQLGIDQLIQKKDTMRQERQTEKIGLEEMDKEIQINIDQAAIKVKAAKMDLASMLFDQKYEITLGKHKNRVIELEQEIERHTHNIEVFQKQLDEGRPVRKKEEKKSAKSPSKDLDLSPEDAEKIKEGKPDSSKPEMTKAESEQLKTEKKAQEECADIEPDKVE